MQADSIRPASVEAIARDRADWLIDAAACASQNRILLRGEPECDEVLVEAIQINAEKAISVAVASALSARDARIREAVEAEREACASVATNFISVERRPTIDHLRDDIANAIRARSLLAASKKPAQSEYEDWQTMEANNVAGKI
jgi:hypothetical protein